MCELDFEGDGSYVWSEKLVKAARVTHACDVCDGSILIGASYMRHFSVYDGNICSENLCMPCYKVMQVFAEAHGVVGVTPSSLEPYLHECAESEGDMWQHALQEISKRRNG